MCDPAFEGFGFGLTAAIPFLPSKTKVAHLLPERKSIMDNKIEVFKNEQFGEIRTALIENEPWFVAVDVCRALEIGKLFILEDFDFVIHD